MYNGGLALGERALADGTFYAREPGGKPGESTVSAETREAQAPAEQVNATKGDRLKPANAKIIIGPTLSRDGLGMDVYRNLSCSKNQARFVNSLRPDPVFPCLFLIFIFSPFFLC